MEGFQKWMQISILSVPQAPCRMSVFARLCWSSLSLQETNGGADDAATDCRSSIRNALLSSPVRPQKHQPTAVES